MIVTGIIVEYNPLHNGHIKHIQMARELTKADVLVAVMSGNFVQRGEPAIIDKFTRTKEALLNEVDLVIELPFPFVNQAASVFAEKAVELLSLAKCDYIVFGSELNDIELLKTYSTLNINVDSLKEVMSDGTSYPKAYSILSQTFSPNDILGVAYLKALKNTEIQPLIIKRENAGYDLEISSASGIRRLIQQNKPYQNFTPMEISSNAVFMTDLYSLIKTKLMTTDPSDLSQLGLFAEGIENNLIKQASKHYDYDSFIDACVSKRYTKARINRTLIFMLTNIKQASLDNLPKLNELRILGFNQVGQKHMRYLIDNEIKIVTRFKNMNKTYRDIELKATSVYISSLNPFQQERIWNREFRGPILLKNGEIENFD